MLPSLRTLAGSLVLVLTATTVATGSTASANLAPVGLPAVVSGPGVEPGVAMIRYASGSHGAFALRADGRLTHSVRTAAVWGAPRDLGGPFTSAPAAVYRAVDNRIDLFAVGTDSVLRTRTSVNGRWGAWRALSGGIARGLSVVRRGNDLDVFGIGADTRVYHVPHRGGRWLARRSLGAGFAGSTSTVARNGVIEVFATTRTRRIMRRQQVAGVWSAWRPVGTARTFAAVSAAHSDGLRLYATNVNRKVYELRRSSTGTWSTPRSLGGAGHGKVGVVGGAAGVRLVVTSTAGGLLQTSGSTTFSQWSAVPGSGYAAAASGRRDLADLLLARWDKNLRGLPGVGADLRAAASGQAIANSSSCGRAVHLDVRLLTLLLAVTDRYQVLVNNMVTGHGCDSGYHPRGRAVDFNTIVDPRTGASTNWRTGSRADNPALDAAFLGLVAKYVTVSAGAGQRQCAGSSIRLPGNFLRFNDFCSHQHIDIRA